MKIKYEDIDRIINILQESKKKLKPGEVFEFSNNKLNIVDAFTLPKRWCVLRTEETGPIINKWFNENNYSDPYINGGYIYIKATNSYGADKVLMNLTKQGIELISFEQFKKYVLNEH